MNQHKIILLSAVATLFVAGSIVYASLSTSPPPQPQDAGTLEECSSCTLRHKTLIKRKEDRARTALQESVGEAKTRP